MILKADFAYLFTILNTNGSKLPNARGLPNLIILPPCITSLCIFNTPVFIQTRKKTPHINKRKKWDNHLVQYQSVFSTSSDEESPYNALPYSPLCCLLSCCLSATNPPFYTQLCVLGLRFCQLYFFLVEWFLFSFCQ